jgi:hypothetical protein
LYRYSAGAGVAPAKPRPISAGLYERMTRGWHGTTSADGGRGCGEAAVKDPAVGPLYKLNPVDDP